MTPVYPQPPSPFLCHPSLRRIPAVPRCFPFALHLKTVVKMIRDLVPAGGEAFMAATSDALYGLRHRPQTQSSAEAAASVLRAAPGTGDRRRRKGKAETNGLRDAPPEEAAGWKPAGWR